MRAQQYNTAIHPRKLLSVRGHHHPCCPPLPEGWGAAGDESPARMARTESKNSVVHIGVAQRQRTPLPMLSDSPIGLGRRRRRVSSAYSHVRKAGMIRPHQRPHRRRSASEDTKAPAVRLSQRVGAPPETSLQRVWPVRKARTVPSTSASLSAKQPNQSPLFPSSYSGSATSLFLLQNRWCEERKVESSPSLNFASPKKFTPVPCKILKNFGGYRF